MRGAREPGSREKEALSVRCREIERRLLDLLTPELVDEHRRSPTCRHSPALAEVLAYLRQAPTEGKLAIFSPPAAPLRVLRLSGAQGVRHDDLGPAETQPDVVAEDAAAHDVFLRRLRVLGADLPAERGPGSAA